MLSYLKTEKTRAFFKRKEHVCLRKDAKEARRDKVASQIERKVHESFSAREDEFTL